MSTEKKKIYCKEPTSGNDPNEWYYKCIDLNAGIQKYGNDYVVDTTFWFRQGRYQQYLSEFIGDYNNPMNLMWDEMKMIIHKNGLMNVEIKQFLMEYVKDSALNILQPGQYVYNKQQNNYAKVVQMQPWLLRTIPKYIHLTNEPKNVQVIPIIFGKDWKMIQLKCKTYATSYFDTVYSSFNEVQQVYQTNQIQVFVKTLLVYICYKFIYIVHA